MNLRTESGKSESAAESPVLEGGEDLTPAQMRIWLGESAWGREPLYHMAMSFTLEGRVDPGRFQQAFAAVVNASDALRTVVCERAGRPYRALREFVSENQIELRDFSACEDAQAAFSEWAEQRIARRFGPGELLFDSVLAKLGERRWVWYLNQHHLVTDARSVELVFRRTGEAYAALERDGKPPAAHFPSYYEVYAGLHSDCGLDRESAETYWRATGVERTPGISFYGNGCRPESCRNRRRSLQLGPDPSLQVRTLAGEPAFRGFSQELSLLAVWGGLSCAWLHRVSGQEAFCMEMPLQNRPGAAARETIGLFMETYPVRMLVRGEENLRELGARFLAETYSVMRHAVPGAAEAERRSEANVVLNYTPAVYGAFAGIPAEVSWLHPGCADPRHAMRLQVHDLGESGRFTVQFDASEELFSEEQQVRSMRHFENLAHALLAEPDRAIGQIDMLTQPERRRVLVDFHEDTEWRGDLRSAHASQVMVHWNERDPKRIALKDGEKTWTYAELSAEVERAAAALSARGVGCGALVSINLSRSAELVITALAVLRCGAAFLPLDPGHPAERRGAILEDSGTELLVAAEAPHGVRRALAVCAPEDLTGGSSRAVISLPDPGPGDLAYVIYTSGSTGRPKGVEVDHGSLARYLDWAERVYVRGSRLVFPLFTSPAFDLTITSLLLPFVSGGSLNVYRETAGPVDAALVDVVRDNAVDIIKLTPAHLALLRQMDVASSRIRRFIVGGEDLRMSLAADTLERFPEGIEIWNEYGPTEAVVGCMIHRFDRGQDSGKSVPIGRPAKGVRIYVLNGQSQLVPEGTPGELCIGGDRLARGYRGLPEETAARFVQDPFESGRRMYRSGDLARFARPGVLEFLGRIDRQVKLRGFRVEPGEIETALEACPGVRSCVVAPAEWVGAVGRKGEGDRRCVRCGLDSAYPGVRFDEEGVCSLCASYAAIKDRASAYFRDMKDLGEYFAERRTAAWRGEDCLMLFSGGKDSTYALCRLVDLGLKVYAFTLDNGYLSEQAKENIRRVAAELGVDHEFGSTPYMNEIFRDSLIRFSNVCNGCFKTIYTLAVHCARARGIRVIVTGLSRGQLFETRLSPRLFESEEFRAADVDRAVIEARKAYHSLDDAVSRTLDVSCFRDDRLFEEIEFVDFYRYCDVGLEEMLSYLNRRVPWIRPSDTGRSTNCLINDAGIYVHRRERGFHNYALPYSWDVRMGHKTREAALEELDDAIDAGRVRKILGEIGYDPDRRVREAGTELAAYYVSERELPAQELREALQYRLPRGMIPAFFVRIDRIPLTAHGKVNYGALPRPGPGRDGGDNGPGRKADPPRGLVEERIQRLWSEVLGLQVLSRQDRFFELGGTSLTAMEVMFRVCREFGIDLPLQTVFEHSSVAALAVRVEEAVLADVEAMSEEEAAGMLEEEQA